MKTCKLTVLKMARYDDLIAQYENPIEHACDMEIGRVFYSENGEKPKGFCDSAWNSVGRYVGELARGGGNFFDGWMKDEYSAMISCDDGFRPVTFYIEVVD